ncbi:hypothetical protein B0A48_11840 [Cryoendolithus antarcticus]|uniref:Uncharacterized protein n=1 Tax=Cryoendolithus antarcticus TaxID=1507870 RepID=A0A1V8ST11_9PEZI|nr:hypothetical protein B0A48_11840 [Cryoendolithus antarcticus]
MASKKSKKSPAKCTTAKASSSGAASKRKEPSDDTPFKSSRTDEFDSAKIAPSVDADQSIKRAKQQRALSPLESMPTELLHDIFVLSENLDLPLASKPLQSQLSNEHLHMALTRQILGEVARKAKEAKLSQEPLRFADIMQTDVQAANRLLNARFFTLEICKSWLVKSTIDTSHLPDASSFFPNRLEFHYTRLWNVNISWAVNVITIPSKLFRAPWTAGKIGLLHVLESMLPNRWPYDETAVDSMAEMTHAGLKAAIADNCSPVVSQLSRYSLGQATKLLRAAVIDHGCDEGTVSALVRDGVVYFEGEMDNLRGRLDEGEIDIEDVTPACEIDFYDVQLRDWANAAKKRGDDKSTWLMELMGEAARSVDDLHAKLIHDYQHDSIDDDGPTYDSDEDCDGLFVKE